MSRLILSRSLSQSIFGEQKRISVRQPGSGDGGGGGCEVWLTRHGGQIFFFNFLLKICLNTFLHFPKMWWLHPFFDQLFSHVATAQVFLIARWPWTSCGDKRLSSKLWVRSWKNNFVLPFFRWENTRSSLTVSGSCLGGSRLACLPSDLPKALCIFWSLSTLICRNWPAGDAKVEKTRMKVQELKDLNPRLLLQVEWRTGQC